MASYFRPTDLDAALKALAEGSRTIVAGGTDFYPARVGKAVTEDVLDVTAIAGLRGIEDRGDHVHVGALTTWTDLIRAELPGWAHGWQQAAREVGGVQIQNAGTIVGNICNASPAADGMPCLVSLDASVRLSSLAGERAVPVSEFVTGNRKTVRRPDEMVTGIVIPKPGDNSRGVFLKLGARRYLVISIVMVSAVLERAADGTVSRLRVAVGSCSEVAKRLTALEGEAAGKKADASLVRLVTADHVSSLSPIGDVRGSADYRRDAALTLVRRAIEEVVR